MKTIPAAQAEPAAAVIAEIRECYKDPPFFASSIPDALAPALRAQLRSMVLQQVDEWLDERETIGLKRFLGRRVAAGQGWVSTANVLTAIFIRLRHGEAVLNITELARETAYSRPSVYRALRYVTTPKTGQPKLLPLHPKKTGSRRPGWWEIRPGIIPSKDESFQIQKSQKYALSSVSVNPSKDFPRKAENQPPKPQAASAAWGPSNDFSLQGAAPLHPAQTGDPNVLLRWLDSPALDLERLPTFGEKRKLSAALRLCHTNFAVSDAVLDALFWRKRLPLFVWRSAVLALVNAGKRFVRPKPPRKRPNTHGVITIDLSDPPPPEHWSHQSSRELQWRGRAAVKLLAVHPDGMEDFLRVLELGSPMTPKSVAKRAVVLDEMIKETEDSLAAIINAAESARPKHKGSLCPECGKPICAEARKPRRRDDPPPRYTIVNGRVSPVPQKVRMLAEYSEHGVYDFYREISDYPDEPDGIYQTRRGVHRCPERLAKQLRSLRSEREKLPIDHSPTTTTYDPTQRARARIRGIDRALAGLRAVSDRERIAWLTSKRTWLSQELKQDRSRPVRSASRTLEQRVWLRLSEARATAAELASDLRVPEMEISAALYSLARKDLVRPVDEREGIWGCLSVGWPDDRPPWEQGEGANDS